MKKIILIITIVVLSLGILAGGGYFAYSRFFADDANEDINIGDTITFGAYEQDGNLVNGKEAIEWIVLDKKDGKMLIISKYALDSQKYHESYRSTSWSECTLRSFLTYDFYDAAFTEEEQDRITKVTNKNEGNETYHIAASGTTYDDIFCLSIEEAEKYFPTNESRKVKATKYTSQRSSGEIVSGGSCWWWLRNPGNTTRYAANVTRSGDIDDNGELVDSTFIGVRPAMWIEIE